MPLAEAATSAAVIVKDYAGAAVAVGAVLVGVTSWLGIGITLPFASAEGLSAVEKTIQVIQTQQTTQIQQASEQSCIILQLLKDRYGKELADAQEELNKNPGSGTLMRARDEASTNVTKINAKLNAPPCG